MGTSVEEPHSTFHVFTQGEKPEIVGVDAPYAENGVLNGWPKAPAPASLHQKNAADIANNNVRVDVYETVDRMIGQVPERRTDIAPENNWKPFKDGQGVKGVQEYPLTKE